MLTPSTTPPSTVQHSGECGKSWQKQQVTVIEITRSKMMRAILERSPHSDMVGWLAGAKIVVLGCSGAD